MRYTNTQFLLSKVKNNVNLKQPKERKIVLCSFTSAIEIRCLSVVLICNDHLQRHTADLHHWQEYNISTYTQLFFLSLIAHINRMKTNEKSIYLTEN